MSAFELHTLLASNRELIANTWNLFLGVHIGILAVFGVRSGPGVGRRIILAAPFYLGFMFLNYRAQVDNYRYARTLLEQLREIEVNQPGSMNVTSRVFESGWVTTYLPALYLACGGFVILLVTIAVVAQARRARQPEAVVS